MKGKAIASKYRLDVIVISSIILLSLLLLLTVVVTKKEGSTVKVEVNGVTVGEYPLVKSGTFSLNGGSNVLVIENGEARMSYSNCPDHTCEKTGRIKYVGQTIVCLPNKVSITVEGSAENGVDLVS